MRILILFFLLLFAKQCICQRTETKLSLKPSPDFEFQIIKVQKFNPVYGFEEDLNIQLQKKGNYYEAILSIDSPIVVTFCNEKNFGIGKSFFIEPGENFKVDVYWKDRLIKAIVKNRNNGNNLILQDVYDSIIVLDRLSKEKNEINFDSLFDAKVIQTILLLKNKYQISKIYENHILIPQIELTRKFLKNQYRRIHNSSSDSFDFPETLFQRPNYEYWSSSLLEYGYFQRYLLERINNNQAKDLNLYLLNILNVYKKQNNQLLNQIAVAQGLKTFFEAYLTDELYQKNIHIADSFISQYKFDISKLNLKNYSSYNLKVVNDNILKNLSFFKSDLTHKIVLSDLLSDTTKIYFFDNWASWCKPCMEGIPYSINLQNRFPKDLEVIFINTETSNSKFKEAESKLHIPKVKSLKLDGDLMNLEVYKQLNSYQALPVYQILIYKNMQWNLIFAANPSDSEIDIQLKNIKNLYLNSPL